MAQHEQQLDMFDFDTPAQQAGVSASRGTPPVRGKSRARVPQRPAVVVDVLAEIHTGLLGLLDDSDRVMVFEDHDRVRVALDEDTVLSLLSEGYAERRPARDTVSCLHGITRKPVTPLRLTRTGRALLHRWGALKPI